MFGSTTKVVSSMVSLSRENVYGMICFWCKRSKVAQTECSLACVCNLRMRVQDETLPDAMDNPRKRK